MAGHNDEICRLATCAAALGLSGKSCQRKRLVLRVLARCLVVMGVLGLTFVGLAPESSAGAQRRTHVRNTAAEEAQIASGEFEGVPWRVAVRQQGGSPCSRIWTNERSSSESCVAYFPRIWSNAGEEALGRPSDRAALLVFFFSSRVKYLNLMVAPKGGGRPQWLHVTAKPLTRSQRLQAGFSQKIGYGVIVARGVRNHHGEVCVKRANAFGRNGARLTPRYIFHCTPPTAPAVRPTAPSPPPATRSSSWERSPVEARSTAQ